MPYNNNIDGLVRKDIDWGEGMVLGWTPHSVITCRLPVIKIASSLQQDTLDASTPLPINKLVQNVTEAKHLSPEKINSGPFKYLLNWNACQKSESQNILDWLC